jgi:hypothetical protein
MPVQFEVGVRSVVGTASLKTLCGFLVACEKAQRRYQWTSGLLLMTLANDPETPKKPAEFVEWLTRQTGLALSQMEVARRLRVYRFYSQFPPETGMVDLIERGGVNIAYRASKVIDHQHPDQARTVLAACVDNPDGIDVTLRQYGEQRRRRADRHVTVNRSLFDHARVTLEAKKQRFRGNDWVPLDQVLGLLDDLEKKTS